MPDLFFIFLLLMLTGYLVCYEIGRRIDRLEKRLLDEIYRLKGKE